MAAETSAVQSGLATLAQYLAGPAFRAAKPARTLLSLLAPCRFPIAHAETFVRGYRIRPGVA